MKPAKLLFPIVLLVAVLLFEVPAAATEETPPPCRNPAHHYARDGVALYYPDSFNWTDEHMDRWVPWENHCNEQNEAISMLPVNGCVT